MEVGPVPTTNSVYSASGGGQQPSQPTGGSRASWRRHHRVNRIAGPGGGGTARLEWENLPASLGLRNARPRWSPDEVRPFLPTEGMRVLHPTGLSARESDGTREEGQAGEQPGRPGREPVN